MSAGQEMQAAVVVAPMEDEYFPMEHAVQDDALEAPMSTEYLPEEHKIQSEMDVASGREE